LSTNHPPFLCDGSPLINADDKSYQNKKRIEKFREVCKGEPYYGKHEGKRYCVLHFPGIKQGADFERAFQQKLNSGDFNFRGVWFPNEVPFSDFEFSADASFDYATFSSQASFKSAVFRRRASFSHATFNKRTSFDHATFNAIDPKGAVPAADFNHATFRMQPDFSSAIFNRAADFSYCSFKQGSSFNRVTFNAIEDKDARRELGFLAADFSHAGFSAQADFSSSTFNRPADFSYTNFTGADFTFATFNEEASFSSGTFVAKADLNSVTFNKQTSFSSTCFHDEAQFVSVGFCAPVNFSSATFGGKVSFALTTFTLANFSYATFTDQVKFAGSHNRIAFTDTSTLKLQFATIRKPEGVSFQSINLRPHWFVDVDPRMFEFTNIEWFGSVGLERKYLTSEGYELLIPPHALLAIACRRLAINAEENHHYEQASRFRYMTMHVRPQFEWRFLSPRAIRLKWPGVKQRVFAANRIRRIIGAKPIMLHSEIDIARVNNYALEWWRGHAPWRLSWWYWLASGYGERAWQAGLVLLGLWIIFAAIFYFGQRSDQWWLPPQRVQEVVQGTRASLSEGQPSRLLGAREALIYSAGVMSLQKPEPLPANKRAKIFVLLETILGPLQAALLALAIRRKFMR
jgi:uncharacterized protein YjbI with pentapeptide repeats